MSDKIFQKNMFFALLVFVNSNWGFFFLLIYKYKIIKFVHFFFESDSFSSSETCVYVYYGKVYCVAYWNEKIGGAFWRNIDNDKDWNMRSVSK